MKSSSSEVFARDTLSAYQRWELASLAGSAPGAGREQAARDAELASCRAEAVAEGRAAGYAAGLAQATAERTRLTALLQTLDAAAGDHEQRLMDEVLDLALVLGRQLVGEALSVRREFVLPIVAAALQQLPQSTQRVQLLVHPDDLELVGRHLAGDATHARCQLQADPLIAPGGCRIETEQCEIDATLPTRWKRLLAGLGRSDEWLEPE
ncbi:MAG: flagellar assembly protein FliH [Betaproteobacteria bacterium]|nr:flagellar assembly protein FliH [Betaproteobacteria bacterium]MBK7080967.1 flagellar assembly protein FliH [Betaproteobacteria bacterium]MBK7590153.1 flagellar assembly protein FliH [Betaproteobacteria bacterium]MBK7743953.1 flagellar assembly protein FliH [Betaproteobacteria bacterium]MBK7791247.1 flagellar assembly protein FliH [Betaproteobacteria bacterium]